MGQMLPEEEESSGMSTKMTEMGKIAGMIQDIETEETPL